MVQESEYSICACPLRGGGEGKGLGPAHICILAKQDVLLSPCPASLMPSLQSIVG